MATWFEVWIRVSAGHTAEAVEARSASEAKEKMEYMLMLLKRWRYYSVELLQDSQLRLSYKQEATITIYIALRYTYRLLTTRIPDSRLIWRVRFPRPTVTLLDVRGLGSLSKILGFCSQAGKSRCLPLIKC